MKNRITTAIIAGGKSSRFGEPKQLAKLGDKRFIDLAIETSGQISKDIMLICSNENWAVPGQISVYHDLFPDSGPLSGIYTAMQYSKYPWIAILPCDMPLLLPGIYRILYQNKILNRPVVASTPKEIEPLVALWPKSQSLAVKELLQLGETSVRRVLEMLDAIKISITNSLPGYRQDVFLNINIKEDLERVNNKFKIN
jgi:molybdopterin-guanine dinucleotide biosynthesis protein A